MNKNNGLVMLALVAGLLVLGVIIYTSLGISYKNDEVKLRNEYESQKGKIEAVHDMTWKLIQQKAGVAKEYAAQFDSIYSHIMSARYDKNDNVLFNWITENNPEFTADLYRELSVTIEVQRKQFLSAQTRILDIVREHNTLLETQPSGWFLEGRPRLEWEVISSTRSKEVMETRTDDDITVF